MAQAAFARSKDRSVAVKAADVSLQLLYALSATLLQELTQLAR